MAESGLAKARGILNPRAGERRFGLSRPLPYDDLAFFVEHYWIVRWDLRGQNPYPSEVLPHPCVHLVIEKSRSRIYGVIREKFSRLLADEGKVFGVKFRPGAFYPFWKSPVSGLTGSSIGIRVAFGVAGEFLEKTVLPREGEGEMVEVVEAFLRESLPERDENVETINRVTDLITTDQAITRVEDVAVQSGINKRTLQRLFERYVGVGPKWVIRRYRLHEVAERLSEGKAVNLAELALELGYFDQAHFINDFKTIVGVTPTDYIGG
ncbi:MAG: helix-turn-helix domain-containing protein [Rubrobacter sp.]|nr:helix-turn-helix domain-containing protein [Rubrobacter sp.]